jgi:hypothetical protein
MTQTKAAQAAALLTAPTAAVADYFRRSGPWTSAGVWSIFAPWVGAAGPGRVTGQPPKAE